MEQTTLYYRAGSSNKIYQCSIEPKGDQFVVNFAFGRRGTTLQTGTKTQSAVDYNAARALYERLIKEKLAKGYTVGETGTPYQHSARQSTGITCQLLNPATDDELQTLIRDPGWWLQEKFDGRRLLVRKEGAEIAGINRLGLSAGIPQSIEESMTAFAGGFLIDGEAVGDKLYAFDLLQIKDEDIRQRTYSERYLVLMNLLASAPQDSIKLVQTAFMPEDKQALFDRLKAENKEGAVFKRLEAPYTAGRPASGGTQLKYKFCETASFIVGKVNAKRSVSLSLLDGTALISVGNVTIPVNHSVPQPGDIIESRYLYAFSKGSIFQPVYLGLRPDVIREECVLTQLKLKAEPEKEAA